MYIYQFLSTIPGHQTHFTAFTHIDDEKSERIFAHFCGFKFLHFLNKELKRMKRITNIEFKTKFDEWKKKRRIWIIKSRELNRVQLPIDSVIGHKWVPTKNKNKIKRSWFYSWIDIWMENI